MKLYYIILTVIVLFSCKKTENKIETSTIIEVIKDTIANNIINNEVYQDIILDSIKLNLNFIPKGNYKEILHAIAEKRIAL